MKEAISPLRFLASELSENVEQVTARATQRPQELVTLSPLHFAEESEGEAPLS